MPTQTRKDAQARRAARREALKQGYEYRPTSAAESEEAERLERGFAMLAGDDIDEAEEDVDIDD